MIEWVKLSTGFYKDEKIRLIRKKPDGDTIALMFVMLMNLAAIENDGGCIPYTAEELGVLLDIPEETAKRGIRELKGKRMLQEENGTLRLTNWEKHQNTAAMDKIREQTRERVRKHREKESQARPLMDVEEAQAIQQEFNEVLDYAIQSGFKNNFSTQNELNRRYGQHGKEKMLEAIEACVKAGKPNFYYLDGCLKEKPKHEAQPLRRSQWDDSPEY